MSILNHKLWPELKPFIIIQKYDRDGSARDPRIRIEVSRTIPPALATRAKRIKVKCAACGEPMHPIRQRVPSKRGTSAQHMYYAATCPLQDKIGCSRSAAAKNEYKAIREDLK